MRRNLPVLFIAFSLAAAAQTLSPPLGRMDGKPPWILAVAIYYGIVHPGPLAGLAAVGGGLLLDGLSRLPTGTSPLALGVLLAALRPLRRVWAGRMIPAAALCGAVAAPWLVALQYAVLRLGGFAPVGAGNLAARMGGAMLLGCLSATAAAACLARLDRWMENVKIAKDIDAIA